MKELTKRQKELLKILAKTEVISSKALGNQLKVSSKTIRNEIHDINSKYKKPCIVSEKGSGYHLIYNDEIRILLEDKEEMPLNRNFLILRELLSHSEVDIYDLADTLFISESTLNKSVQTLNDIINRRNPEIQIQRHHNALRLNGSEEARRQVSTYFLMHELEEYNFDLSNYAEFFTSFDFNKLREKVFIFNKEHNLKMKDLEIISFVMHIAVMMDRILRGNEILMPESAQADESQKKLANLFYKDLQAWLPITMSDIELNYLSCLFAGKMISEDKEQLREIECFVNKIINEIKQTYEIDLTADSELCKNLQMHMLGLKNRIEHRTFLNNPLMEDIRSHFPIMYDISVFMAMRIQEHFQTRLQEGEIGYITLHLMSAVERLNAKTLKKIVVVSPIGEAVNGYIRKKLSVLHDLTIVICEILSIFDMEKIEKYQPDLVVSLMSLPKAIPFPCYVCEGLLNSKDLDNIYNKLKDGENEKRQNIEKFFDKKLFFCNQDFEEKEAVIRFLCEKLFKLGYVGENYMDYVMKREQIAPTTYGNLFAIPHPIEKCAFENMVSICILKKPILWNDQKVRIIFLFSLSKKKDDEFDGLFTQLVSLLDNIEKVKKLIKTKELEEFLKVFNEI